MSATSTAYRPTACACSRVTPWDVRLMVIFGVDDVEDVAQRQYAVGVIHGGELNRRVASGRAISKLTTCWPSGDHEVAGTGEIRTAICSP